MTLNEASGILNRLSKLHFDEMKLEDQFAYIALTVKYAEEMKPLADKYVSEVPRSHTYKLSDGGIERLD